MNETRLKYIEDRLTVLEDRMYNEPSQPDAWYYYIDSDGFVYKKVYVDTPADKNRKAMGNCFSTKEEARFMVERLKVIAELKQLGGRPYDPEASENWTLVYDMVVYGSHNPVVLPQNTQECCGCVYQGLHFDTIEQTQDVIVKIGEERLKKYYFRIEN